MSDTVTCWNCNKTVAIENLDSDGLCYDCNENRQENFDLEKRIERVLDTQHELREHGRRSNCLECGNPLTEKDEDHSFCNNCWNLLMAHPFDGKDKNDLCRDCGEAFQNEMHKESWNV
jgi:DNA-directed RNA polymerase subunit M/transcription elongation factor TFIIS